MSRGSITDIAASPELICIHVNFYFLRPII
uniref:Predicted protein n=1 Tax=Hordeum vulgare subsp. vulgare TaxID=112509 RepID=F2D7Y2_HORVV|nr:predicted protein [Hordeum vulgare subsp. vulgare]